MAASSPWLTLESFKSRTLMTPEDVDELESRYPGFTAARLATNQGWIESRLRKRYAIPFASPFPEAALGWLVSLVDFDLYRRRGFNPTSAQDALIAQAATDARAEVKEAADAQAGLYDLPLRHDTAETSGIAGGPLGYSEASPYVWTEAQRETGSSEDSQ